MAWNSEISDHGAHTESLLPSLVSVFIVKRWEATLHCPLSQVLPSNSMGPGGWAYSGREEGWMRTLVPRL